MAVPWVTLDDVIVQAGSFADRIVIDPRRHGAVYGEEYRLAAAEAVVTAISAGRPIPPTPTYSPSRF